MKRAFTNCRTTSYRKIALTLLLSLLTLCAQISLVKWENFFFGSPPILPNTYLPMNNGKELSNAGQSSSFISGGQYIANVWADYSSNTIVFVFGAFQFGAKNFKLQYATGTPTTFTDFGAAISFPAAGESGTYTYNLPANCNNQANVYIRITATSAGGAGGDYLENFEAKGTAMTAPSITSQPGSSTICEGADATYSVVASNAISYQWQFRTSGAGTFADCPNSAAYDNETTAALTVNDVTAAMSGYQFRCIVTGGTTPDATSNTVTMTVNAYGTWNGSANNQWSNTSTGIAGRYPHPRPTLRSITAVPLLLSM